MAKMVGIYFNYIQIKGSSFEMTFIGEGFSTEEVSTPDKKIITKVKGPGNLEIKFFLFFIYVFIMLCMPIISNSSSSETVM